MPLIRFRAYSYTYIQPYIVILIYLYSAFGCLVQPLYDLMIGYQFCVEGIG